MFINKFLILLMNKIILIIIIGILIIYYSFTPLLLYVYTIRYNHKYFNESNIRFSGTTPNIIFQTYYNKPNIPTYIYNNIKQFSSGYTHYILDDNDCEYFLTKYYNSKVLKTFKELKKGAHKADLIRYCLLYIYGGYYMDIKTELILPMDIVFPNKNIMYTVLSETMIIKSIYQGIIATPPNNLLFIKLINYIVERNNPIFYLDFCCDFYYQIYEDTNKVITLGLNKGKIQSYYIFNEECSIIDCSKCYDGFDKYHACCFVTDFNKPIIKMRRSSYPW